MNTCGQQAKEKKKENDFHFNLIDLYVIYYSFATEKRNSDSKYIKRKLFFLSCKTFVHMQEYDS